MTRNPASPAMSRSVDRRVASTERRGASRRNRLARRALKYIRRTAGPRTRKAFAIRNCSADGIEYVQRSKTARSTDRGGLDQFRDNQTRVKQDLLRQVAEGHDRSQPITGQRVDTRVEVLVRGDVVAPNAFGVQLLERLDHDDVP